MSRQVSSNAPSVLSPEHGAGVPDLREAAISPGAAGSGQSATDSASAGPSEVPIAETPPMASEPVNCNPPKSADLSGIEGLDFGDGMNAAIDSTLDCGLDTEEITIDLPCVETGSAVGAMAHALGTAVDNHRHGQPQEDRHYASSFPALTAEQSVQFLTDTIAAIDADTRDYESGSTITSVVVTEDGNLVTAHLGDSPASAIVIGEQGVLKDVVQLIKDHRPANDPTLWEAEDGTFFQDVKGRRLVLGAGSINVTHALGDRNFGAALSHQPEIRTHVIQAQLQPGDRLFVLLTSDGAHNKKKEITHSSHTDTLVRGLQRKHSFDQIARQIAVGSKDIKDNVTVLLLEVEVGKGAVLGVFDGHGGSETSQRACDLFKTYVETFLGS